jgi:hypothetical protein
MSVVVRNLDVTELLKNAQYYVNMSTVLNKNQSGRARVKGIWHGMIRRCADASGPRNQCYRDSNIKVCQDWLYSFDNFYLWATANGYQDDLTLDRVNNDLSYNPNNCRWVSRRRNVEYVGKISRPEIGF